MTVLIVFALCLAGAVLPLVGSEVVILGSALGADGLTCGLLIVSAAGAQSIGKLLVYASAERGARTEMATRMGMPTLRAAFDRSRLCVAMILFASALVSVPPLFATTMMCGAARYGRLWFGLVVFVARLVRYACLIVTFRLAWWGR